MTHSCGHHYLFFWASELFWKAVSLLHIKFNLSSSWKRILIQQCRSGTILNLLTIVLTSVLYKIFETIFAGRYGTMFNLLILSQMASTIPAKKARLMIFSHFSLTLGPLFFWISIIFCCCWKTFDWLWHKPLISNLQSFGTILSFCVLLIDFDHSIATFEDV